MLVYRYLCEDEYRNIMTLNFDKIGNVYYKKNFSNTFRYKKDERYLHFFKDKESMLEMQKLYLKDGKEYYFCAFDIPTLTLLKGMGRGFYENSGYDVMHKDVREFIVKVKHFNPKWIIDAVFDEKKHNYILENSALEPVRE